MFVVKGLFPPPSQPKVENSGEVSERFDWFGLEPAAGARLQGGFVFAKADVAS